MTGLTYTKAGDDDVPMTGLTYTRAGDNDVAMTGLTYTRASTTITCCHDRVNLHQSQRHHYLLP